MKDKAIAVLSGIAAVQLPVWQFSGPVQAVTTMICITAVVYAGLTGWYKCAN